MSDDAAPPPHLSESRVVSTGGVPPAPQTGDDAIDEALARLHERATAGSVADQVEAGEHTHQVLQGRLGDLGGR